MEVGRQFVFMEIKQKPKALNKCQISPSISCVAARIKVIKYTKGPSKSAIKLSCSHSSSSIHNSLITSEETAKKKPFPNSRQRITPSWGEDRRTERREMH